jgi:hypothetical protein
MFWCVTIIILVFWAARFTSTYTFSAELEFGRSSSSSSSSILYHVHDLFATEVIASLFVLQLAFFPVLLVASGTTSAGQFPLRLFCCVDYDIHTINHLPERKSRIIWPLYKRNMDFTQPIQALLQGGTAGHVFDLFVSLV